MQINGIFKIKLRKKLTGNIVFVHNNCWFVSSKYIKLLGTLQISVIFGIFQNEMCFR